MGKGEFFPQIVPYYHHVAPCRTTFTRRNFTFTHGSLLSTVTIWHPTVSHTFTPPSHVQESGGAKATINALSVFDVQVRGACSFPTNHISAITPKAKKSQGFSQVQRRSRASDLPPPATILSVPGLAHIGPATNSAMRGDEDIRVHVQPDPPGLNLATLEIRNHRKMTCMLAFANIFLDLYPDTGSGS